MSRLVSGAFQWVREPFDLPSLPWARRVSVRLLGSLNSFVWPPHQEGSGRDSPGTWRDQTGVVGSSSPPGSCPKHPTRRGNCRACGPSPQQLRGCRTWGLSGLEGSGIGVAKRLHLVAVQTGR